MTTKTIFGSLLACLSLNVMVQAAPLILTQDGTAQAEIVLDITAPQPQLEYAVQELTNWIAKITGAVLPVSKTPADLPVNIYLGTPRHSSAVASFAKKYAADFKRLEGNDGFIIRAEGNNLYLAAACTKGVLNSVYRFLEQNSDIVFVRPLEGEEGFGTIYSKNPAFVVQKADICDVPAFIERFWTGNTVSYVWQARNLNNMRTDIENLGSAQAFEVYDKIGTEMIIQGGFQAIFPDAIYRKSHPEFYPMIGGRRFFREDSQLCFTSPGMIAEYKKNFSFIVSNAPPRVKVFNVGHGDNWDLCECPNCLAPIKLPDGQVVRPEDPDFRSTQYFLFVNQVAAALKKISPQSQLATLAYLWCAQAPRMPVTDNVQITYCPYVKDQKKPVFDERNQAWADKFKDWPQRSKELGLFEYYLCYTTPLFYHPTGDIMAQDLRYYKERGLKRVYLDVMRYDDPGQALGHFTFADVFSVSAIEFWVAARLMWNPYQDVEKLRDEFCRRAYREAAAPMREYYAKIREVWHKNPERCWWNEDPALSARRYVIEPGLTDPLRALLTKAEAAASHPGSKKLIEMQRAAFEKWTKLEQVTEKKLELLIPQVDGIPRPEDWKNALVIDQFFIPGHWTPPPPDRTALRLLHNRKHLFMAIRCEDKEMAAVRSQAVPAPHDQWSPHPSKFEIFIQSDAKTKWNYYHLVFDAAGSRYDALGWDLNWNPDWNVQIQKRDDAWGAIVSIPFKDIGIEITLDNKLSMMFYRTDHSSWNTLAPYNVNDLQNFTLKME